MINEAENYMLINTSNALDIKQAMFDLDGSSAPSLDNLGVVSIIFVGRSFAQMWSK